MAVSDSITKQCCKCKASLSSDSFGRDSRASDGLQSRCARCANDARNAARNANPEKARALRRGYYDANKELVLATNSKSRAKHDEKVKAHKKAVYLREKDRPDFIAKIRLRTASRKDEKFRYDREYRARKATHLTVIHKAWRAKNPDKVRAIRFSYDARRRQQVLGGDSTREVHKWERAALKVCHWCGAQCLGDYHIDHYEPLSKGGKHAVANLVIACPRCNLKKNAKDPYEFAASLGRLF